MGQERLSSGDWTYWGLGLEAFFDSVKTVTQSSSRCLLSGVFGPLGNERKTTRTKLPEHDGSMYRHDLVRDFALVSSDTETYWVRCRTACVLDPASGELRGDTVHFSGSVLQSSAY